MISAIREEFGLEDRGSAIEARRSNVDDFVQMLHADIEDKNKAISEHRIKIAEQQTTIADQANEIINLNAMIRKLEQLIQDGAKYRADKALEQQWLHNTLEDLTENGEKPIPERAVVECGEHYEFTWFGKKLWINARTVELTIRESFR